MHKKGIIKSGITAILLFAVILLALFVSANVFLDDTDTDWDKGTLHNMKVFGTGGDANISSSGNNVSGHFASQVFDAGANANWTNITIRTEVPYGTEIGRAFDDSNEVTDELANAHGFLNTTGLVLLMHFNNETGEFERKIGDIYDISQEKELVLYMPFDSENAEEIKPNGSTVLLMHFNNDTGTGENASLFLNNATFGNGTGLGNGTCVPSANRCPVFNESNARLGIAGLEFDGSNDFVNLSQVLSPSLPASLTWEAWIKTESAAGQMIIAANTAAWGNTLLFFVKATTGEIRVFGSGDRTGTTDVTDNEWHHVAFTLEDSTNTGIIYVDGIQENSFSETNNINSDDFMSIGTEYDGGGIPSEFFDGTMDEVAIWNVSLSSEVIARHSGYGIDKSIYGNNATFMNGSVNFTSKFGEGWEFDGKESHIRFAQDTDYDLDLGEWSFGTWFNLRSLKALTYLYNIANDGSFGLVVRIDGGGDLEFYWDNDPCDSWDVNQASLGTSFSTNRWYYLVVLREGDTIRAYVDGVDTGTTATVSGTDGMCFDSTTELWMGAGRNPDGTPYNPINGTMDEFTLWNKTLSADTIAEHAGIKVLDYSGFGNNGTRRNGSNYNATGKFGKGMLFDGFNDYVEVNESGGASLSITGDITIGAWIKPDFEGSVGGVIVGKGNANDGATYMFRIVNGGFLNFFADSAADGKTSSHVPTLGEWSHVAVTFVPSTNELIFYMNGVANSTETTDNPVLNSCPVVIGVRDNSASGCGTEIRDFFNGTIDEVAIWNRSLSSDEIRKLYLRGALRLNLSVRSCDDSACVGETYQQVSNLSFMGSVVPLNVTANNRYFQYNLTYSRNASGVDGNHTIINNVSIEYTVTLLNITVNLNDTSVFENTNDPVAVSGHINLSDGTNVSNTLVNAFIDDAILNISTFSTGITKNIIEFNATDWDLGTAINVTINPYNITLNKNGSNQYPNQTGNFTSQVIDTGRVGNFTFISWTQEVPYQTEIGRAVGDNNDATDEDGFINTSGLVLLMHFNNESALGEATETTSAGDNYTLDFSVDVNSDRSGSERNNGSFINGATINKTNYKFGGGSAKFDGNDDFVVIDPLVNDIQTNTVGTIEAWYKTNILGVSHTIFAASDSGDANSWVLLYQNTGNDVIAGCSEAGVSKYNNGIGVTQVTDRWYHVAMVQDGVAVKVYLDGVKYDLTGSPADESCWFNTVGNIDKVSVGVLHRGGSADLYFNGAIDEVAIWNRTLSADEILKLYKRGALKLNLSVRSCDDSACDGESYSDYFTNASGIVLNETVTPINRYFQYRFNFETNDTNQTPVLYNVTINYTTLATDSFGNYNFTFAAPSDAGTYTIKVNATFSGIDGQSSASLSVEAVTMNITLNLNDTSVFENTNDPVAVSGHINLSDGTNVTNTPINIFIDDDKMNKNDSVIENATNFNFGTAINVTINADNITLKRGADTEKFPNQTGEFTSVVLDVGPVHRNFTFISWEQEVPYQTEIGRAVGDNNDATDEDGFINTSGLVLLMHFNNESAFGENATGGDGDIVFDFSGLGNNGTTHNGATINKTNYKLGGGALELDGVDNYVDINNSDIPAGNNPRTIETWIILDAISSSDAFDRAIVFGTATAGNSFLLGADDDGAGTAVWRFSGHGLGNLDGTSAIDLGEWHHVVATYDGAGIVSLYVNGVLEGTKDVTSIDTKMGVAFIGSTIAQTVFWDGRVDEVAIWNRSLSADEILQHYKRGALSLNLSVRSCDDSSCSGEGFSEVLTNASGIPLNTSITPINRYFQYKFVFNTIDINYTPALYNVTINYTTLATDSFGNYNFTFNAPSTAATYTIKVNATFSGIDGESSASLSVEAVTMNITVNLNDTSVVPNTNDPVAVSGHINLSDGRNATNNLIHIFIDETEQGVNQNFIDDSDTDFLKGNLSVNASVVGTGGSAHVAINISSNLTQTENLFDRGIDVNASVVLYLRFEEGTGQYANDSSQYKFNNGTLGGATGGDNGEPSWNSTTKFENFGLSFDGSNDLVNVSDDDSLDLTTAFTLEAWIYPRTVSITHNFITKHSDAGASGYQIMVNSQVLQCQTGDGTTWTNGDAASGNVMVANEWQHVLCVFDGSSLKVYRNGVEVGEDTTVNTIAKNNVDLWIGNNVDAGVGSFDFDGNIDEVLIWNVSLSPDIILEHFQKGWGYFNTSNFTSQTFDAGTEANWTSISWAQEVPYDKEIGRASGDGNSATDEDGFINTSGLVLLMHFNNESALGEATETTSDGDNYSLDFSVDVNSERSGSSRNNGTFLNGATISKTNYKFGGGAGEFDGSDDYVSIGDLTNFDDARYSISVSMWIKPGNFDDPVNQMFFDKHDESIDRGWTFNNGGDGGTILFGLKADGWIQGRSTNAPLDNTWTYIAATYDGSKDVSGVSIYINGVAETVVSMANALTTNDISNNINAQVGARNGANFPFDGTIDEVALWNRTLSSTEIRNLYKRGVLRLNLSYRTSNDSTTFSAWKGVSNNTISTIGEQARYLEYKAVFNTTDNAYTPILNNVTINYTGIFTDGFGNYNYTLNAPSNPGTYTIKVNTTFSGIDGQSSAILSVGESNLPVINGTLNKSISNIFQNDIINATFNATDDIGLDTGQIIINDTGFKRYFNFTLSGTTDQFSQNFTVSCGEFCVINITGRVNDTSGNFAQNETIITVTRVFNPVEMILNTISELVITVGQIVIKS